MLNNLSSQGKIIMAILIVAIIFFAIDKPKTPKIQPTIKLGPRATAVEGIPPVSQDPGAEIPPPMPSAPAPVAAPAPAPVTAAGVGPDFELLKERLGRSDPFEPLHPPVALPPTPTPAPITMNFPKLPSGIGLPPLYVDRAQQFSLSGIAVVDGKGIAIVNGDMYRVGDNIKNYRVDQITRDTVRLRGDTGEILTLAIHQAPKSEYSVKNGTISNYEALKQSSGQQAPVPVPLPVPAGEKMFDSGL